MVLLLSLLLKAALPGLAMVVMMAAEFVRQDQDVLVGILIGFFNVFF